MSIRVRPTLLMMAGSALLAVSAVAACQGQPADDFGPAALPSPSVESVAPSAVPAAPSSGRQTPVARLSIPAMDLDVSVDAVGVDPKTGEFAVPPSVDRVGWYRYGPGFAAEAGSIVISGHVDSADEGEGAFFKLGSLKDGERVTLAAGDGKSQVYEVVARKRYLKTEIPLEEYFARDGRPRLTLITCGGEFDEKTGHYRDNVVVTAVPS